MRRRALLVGGLLLVALGGFTLGTWHRGSDAARSVPSQAAMRYTCPMHPQYVVDRPGDCPICGMRLVALDEHHPSSAGHEGEASAGTAMQVSGEKRQLMGIRVEEVARKPLIRTVRTTGRVAADETRIYRITAATSGWIEKALPNTVGTQVRKDETLATFYAREFLGVQQTYFYALDALDRFREQNASEAQMAATNVQVQNAIDNLRALGMSRTQIGELARTRQRTYEIDVTAPGPGFILERRITEGQRIQAGDELYVLANLDRVWVLADVFESERTIVKPGTSVPIVYGGQARHATISNVLPEFDAVARTLRVRLELDNPGYVFRPGMFVDVEFPVNLPAAIVVPADAVIDSGVHKTVFVEHGDGRLEARDVRTGWRFEGEVEIVDGLEPGERIVTSGTFLIDSESRMKAAAAAFAAPTERDVVCGMEVDRAKAMSAGLTATHNGTTYYFCSEECRKKFEASPGTYVK